MGGKKVSLQVTLSAVIAVLIVAVSLSIIVVSYISSSSAVLYLSERMTNEVSKGIIDRTRSILDSAEKANTLTAYAIKSGIIDLSDGKQCMDFAAHIIMTNIDFASVDIGLSTGEKYKAERMPDGSISRRSYTRTKDSVVMTWYHDNPQFAKEYKDSVKSLAKGYDSRTRPWWITAVTNKKLSWTDMYVSGTRKQFVYSNVIPVYDDANEILSVATIDVNVVSLSEFLGTVSILQRGKAVIVNDKNQIIALPVRSPADLEHLLKKTDKDAENPYELNKIEDSPDGNIKAAFLEYNRLLLGSDKKPTFDYVGEHGEKYIARIVDFPYKADTVFKVGIIIPKSDIVGTINRDNVVTMVLAFFFLVAAIVIGFFTTKNITRSLISLTREVNKVAKLDFDSTETVSTNIFEVDAIDRSVKNMQVCLKSFKKYVPAELVLNLNTRQKEAVLEGERKQLTMFLSDIANFTSISENLTPEKLVENLGIYFAGMSQAILETSGTLDKYIGDAIMAFWGAPTYMENHAQLACRAALGCQTFLKELERRWQTREWSPMFYTRIGIHTGEVIVGNIGYDERMNYTVIGDNVNLTSRLEGLNKYYGTKILVSETTRERVMNAFVTRKLDKIAVAGKAKSTYIHELVASRDSIGKEELAFVELFSGGVDMYFGKEWREAARVFVETYKKSGNGDLVSRILFERCKVFAKNPPPEDWNGIYRFSAK